MTNARRVVLGVLFAEVTVLLITGVALFFWYRPDVTRSWDDFRALNGSTQAIEVVRVAHRWTSTVMLLTAAALCGLLLADRRRMRWSWRVPGSGMVAILLVVGSGITGYLLPWDQLALRVVEVDADYRGYTWIFDETVRFVLLGSTEIGRTTISWWLLGHVALGIALVGTLVRRYRRDFRGESEPDRSHVTA